MRSASVVISLFFVSAAALASAAPLQDLDQPTFFVSPNGKDTWTGRLAAPNREGSDGPFATISRARDAVR